MTNQNEELSEELKHTQEEFINNQNTLKEERQLADKQEDKLCAEIKETKDLLEQQRETTEEQHRTLQTLRASNVELSSQLVEFEQKFDKVSNEQKQTLEDLKTTEKAKQILEE